LIGPKHFFNTAGEVGFPLSRMEQILNEMGSMTSDVINKVADELPVRIIFMKSF